MGRVNPIFTAFTAGELSPRLDGRVDLKTYHQGCRVLENLLVWPHGGAAKRPGTYFIAEAKDPTKPVRLIPFEYSATQAYILELGHQTIRFYMNGGQVQSGGGACEIASPWSGDELSRIKFVQSADTMYLVHPDHAPRKLTRSGHADWTLEQVDFTGGPFLDENTSEVAFVPGAATGTGVALSTADLVVNGDFASDISGWDDVSDAGGSVAHDAGTASMEITGGGAADYGHAEQEITVEAGRAYTLAFTVSGADVIMRLGTTSGGEQEAGDASYAAGSHTVTVTPTTTSLFVGFRNLSATATNIDDVTFKAHVFVSGHVGALFSLAWENVEERKETSVSSSTGSDQMSDAIEVSPGGVLVVATGSWSATVTLQRSHDGGVTWYDHAAWTANTNTVLTEAQSGIRYRVGVKNGDYTSGTVTCYVARSRTRASGIVKITAVTDATSATVDVVDDLPQTSATTLWAEGAWSTYRGFPVAVAFFEQRLVFAGTAHRPQTVWGSVVDDYEHFAAGAYDSDSWGYTLAAERVNVVRWLASGKVLHIGTVGGEWRLGAASASDPVTPTRVEVRRETAFGSADVQALSVGNAVLFIQRGGRKLRSALYDFRNDGWVAPDLSILSEHILSPGVCAMAWSGEPDPVLWLVREDGVLVTVCYDPVNEVTAHARQVTDGHVESVAVIPGDDRDEVWLVVRRVVNGAAKRYVEQLQASAPEDQDDSFYVDSGLTFHNSATITGATRTDPVIVTAASHGFSDGATIEITGVAGMAELNGNTYTVASATADTFELAGTDGTAFGAYASGGTAEEVRTTLSGLSHLEGKTLAVLADGAVRPRVTVSGGSVTLSSPAKKVHAGLPYSARLKTMRIEAGARAGTAQGRRIRAFRCVVRLYRTLGALVGPDFSAMDSIPFRSSAHTMDSPPSLFTGDREIEFRGGFSGELYVCLAHEDPLPFAVVAVMPTVYTSDA
ncbi:MAG: ubiquitin-activating E1 FCCH domain-containing protein [Desulfatibacillaceae bacterium]